jgi:hypothetical protein
MTQMAKWKELPPPPEAIVDAALESVLDILEDEGWVGESMRRIGRLASDPAEVAAIIKKAGEDRG